MDETLVERIKMAAQFIDKEKPSAGDWICCADSLVYCLADAVVEKRKAMEALKDVQG
jgi:hypothetical protein